VSREKSSPPRAIGGLSTDLIAKAPHLVGRIRTGLWGDGTLSAR
jgi:hypothetical protein